MSLRHTVVLSSLAIASVLGLSTAHAADEAGKPTKSGALAPAGEGPGTQSSAPSRMSDKSRSSVKASTAAANKAGELAPAGPNPAPVGQTTSNQDADKSMAPKTSTKSRAAVKDATKSDRSTGALQPAGEAAQPVNEAPKK